LGQFPDSDDEENTIEDHDDANGYEETQDEITIEREPAAATHVRMIN